MTTLQPLGKIVRLQIQRSTLSLGDRLNRYFDPAGLLSVETLQITSRGAVAQLPGGQTLLDYHHADYPGGRNEGDNDLSINFTTHYDEIRSRYGEAGHLFNGCGGENILVETARRLGLEALSGGIAIQTRDGPLAWLTQVSVARPCQPFSTYVAHPTGPSVLKDALQFLDDGTRGFYCVFESETPVTIAMGDEVFVAAS